MAIEFNCDSCGYKLRAPDAAAGKRGKCPKCRKALVVPVGSYPPSDATKKTSDMKASLPPSPNVKPATPRPHAETRARPAINKTIVAAIIAGGLVLCCVLVLLALWLFPPSAEIQIASPRGKPMAHDAPGKTMEPARQQGRASRRSQTEPQEQRRNEQRLTPQEKTESSRHEPVTSGSKYASLKEAAAAGDLKEVHKLLAVKADENQANLTRASEEGLLEAVRQGHPKVVQALVESLRRFGPDPVRDRVFGDLSHPWKLLHWAAFVGHSDVAEFLISSGADINAIAGSEPPHDKKLTPLHIAAFHGHEKIVTLFLAKGADPNALAKSKATALHFAASRGHVGVAKRLLDSGADTEAKASSFTPMELAVFCSQKKMVDFLYAIRKQTADDEIARFAKLAPRYNRKNRRDRAFSEKFGPLVRKMINLAKYEAAAGDITTLQRILAEAPVKKKQFSGKEVKESLIDRNGPLVVACAAGLKKVVELLLAEGGEINEIDRGPGALGATPLQAAATAGRADMIAFLLDRGAKINKSAGDKTPLGVAIQAMRKQQRRAEDFYPSKEHMDKDGGGVDRKLLERRRKAVLLLLERGSLVHTDMLSTAVQIGDADILQALMDYVERGQHKRVDLAKWNSGALSKAARLGHESIVRLLLDRGTNQEVNKGHGAAALKEAAREGQYEVVELLLAKGVDPNGTGKNGRTPLCSAVSQGHAEVLKLLLSKGADVTHGDPLNLAARAGREDMVRLLLDASAQPSMKTLSFAITTGKKSIAALLAAEVVDADSEKGSQALREAATRGCVEAAKLLVAKGADVNTCDKHGNALTRAAVMGHHNLELIRLLIASGADVNAKDDRGETALVKAVGCGINLPMIKLLLEAGADVTVRDRHQRSLLQIAQNCPEYQKLLKQYGAH